MKKIKLFDPAIGDEEEKSIVNTLKSHLWASGSGEGHVKEFENKKLCKVERLYCG